MPLKFTLPERLIGFCLTTAGPNERVAVAPSDLIPPADAFRLTQALEHLQATLFDRIPNFPPASVIDHLVLIIKHDLTGTAYVNELGFTASVRVNRAVEAGGVVRTGDITDIASVDPGVEIPHDCAVVVVRSHGWKRSLYFDFGPLGEPPRARAMPLNQVLARQSLLLYGIPSAGGAPGQDGPGKGGATPAELMAQGFQQLHRLLDEKCDAESAYQELLENHPWMLGGQYESVQRHLELDDRNIPDFTAMRAWDKCHDIIELKQPFLKCFRSTGALSSDFNDAWNQAERYLSFARRQRDYLREEKGIRFENPRTILVIGYGLDDDSLRKVREKESIALGITVLTYEQLLELARHVLFLMRLAQVGAQPDATGGAG